MSTGNLDFSKTLQRAALQSRKMAVMAQSWTRSDGLIEREERSRLRRLAPWITVVVLLALWQIATMTKAVAPALLPAPLDVGDRFIRVIGDGRLWTHFRITLVEVVAGLGLGVSLGVALGYAIAHQ
jgi:ABC-type nitrate/sulfonate/bicarbonate transport system permease component